MTSGAVYTAINSAVQDSAPVSYYVRFDTAQYSDSISFPFSEYTTYNSTSNPTSTGSRGSSFNDAAVSAYPVVGTVSDTYTYDYIYSSSKSTIYYTDLSAPLKEYFQKIMTTNYPGLVYVKLYLQGHAKVDFEYDDADNEIYVYTTVIPANMSNGVSTSSGDETNIGLRVVISNGVVTSVSAFKENPSGTYSRYRFKMCNSTSTGQFILPIRSIKVEYLA